MATFLKSKPEGRAEIVWSAHRAERMREIVHRFAADLPAHAAVADANADAAMALLTKAERDLVHRGVYDVDTRRARAELEVRYGPQPLERSDARPARKRRTARGVGGRGSAPPPSGAGAPLSRRAAAGPTHSSDA